MDEALKVGALAKKTGLTVRTLHHYDEIGLLSPSRRTPSRHRLYGAEELSRLQQIASLKQIGLSLDEIRVCLARPEYSLEAVLTMHADRIQARIEEQERLAELIVSLRDRVRSGQATSVEELTRTIQGTVDFARYYSAEQLDTLEARRDTFDPGQMRAAQEEWAEIFEAFARAMDEGLPPDAPEVEALAQRSAALIEMFTGGDPEMAASLGRLYEREGPDRVLSQQGMEMPDGLWEYMAAARAAGAGS